MFISILHAELGYEDLRKDNCFPVNYLLIESQPNSKKCKMFFRKWKTHHDKENLLSRAIASSYAHKMRIFCEGCSKIEIPERN